MGPRPKNWCQTVVLKAISVAVPSFKHSCTCTAHKAAKVHGSRIDDYCTAVNGTETKTNLVPTGLYSVCHQMRVQVIDKLLPPEAVIAAANPDLGGGDPGNTNAAIHDPPGGSVTRPDPPGGGLTAGDPPVGGIVICCPGPRSQNRKQQQK